MNGDEHVLVAIGKCRTLIPTKIRKEAARRLNNILHGISSVPIGVRKAMTNYLFEGFVEQLSAGLPIDESLIVDGRSFNSRGGRGIVVTEFEIFWDECRV